ncbi:dihydrofolate reductase (plasmid) [Klebsiella pneumoniae subsp. pneumoniae]|uniref:Dihydrofolate reductase n=1 Tax=Klebsiella pneumoniae subsp. pneumoniae TaxID=72407 RepID=A0A7S9HF94_KLEPN|nr:dihydrofolate reductase [Klebsiella pneumoniae subsp. pneumoniae]
MKSALATNFPALPDRSETVQTTHQNATVVMGRKTMESLKRPLPERHNLALTRSRGYIPNGFYPQASMTF